ncbi:MAG: single-stranded DNA-binding protein, partial [Fusobacteriia bacterium 4572_132]
MNDVNLIGRLTRDPLLKYIPGSGTAVSEFTLAVDKGLSKAKKKELETKGKPTADFIRIIAWGK